MLQEIRFRHDTGSGCLSLLSQGYSNTFSCCDFMDFAKGLICWESS